ncbi:MAG TPA: hypothetical protein VF555_16485 [Variovorax sp.]
MKVNANQFMFFPDFQQVLLDALRDGHSVVEFKHTWGGDSGYGRMGTPRLDIEFEARITRINGDAVPRIKASKKATKKEAKQ